MERARVDALRRLRVARGWALYTLLLLMLAARQSAWADAGEEPSYGDKKARMEIRVQDYSYNNGARERPVIEVVAQDIRTSDMLSLAQKLSRGNQLFERMGRSRGGSWWQQPVVDDLTVGDVVLLMSFALAALLALRMVAMTMRLAWAVVLYPFRASTESLRRSKPPRRRKSGANAEKQQQPSSPPADPAAALRACHSQLLQVIHKLHREYREASAGDNTQDLVASLTLSRHQDGSQHVTLDDIARTLEEIQSKDASLSSIKLDEMPAQTAVDAAMEDAGVRDAWDKLQRLYSSFRSLQASISRQHVYKRDAPLRRRHQGSFDDRNDEVLRVLSELTKELPQGFTSEMFASLGSAMHRAMVDGEPPPRATAATAV